MHNTQENGHNEHGDKVFVFVEQYYPKDGKLDDVLLIATKSAEGMREIKGLLQSKVLKSIDKDGPVCNILTWKSISDFKSFMKSDIAKKMIKSDSMKNMLNWTNDIKIFQFDLVDGWHPEII